MAALIPMVAAAGAAAGTTGAAMTALTALSSVAGGIASYSQAKGQQDNIDLQARVAEINGRKANIDATDNLLKSLARSNASSGARGLEHSGSILRGDEASMRNLGEFKDANTFNTDMNVSALNQKKRVVGGQGITALTGSLFNAGKTTAKLFNG